MPNHVIRDRIWESRKLRQCSRDAALAYPWIYLVADPWGRFEYNPTRIWALVFGGRGDVSQEDVTRWLEEYTSVGLLFRYHVDGELAVWTGYPKRGSGFRKPSQYPDPEPFMEITSKVVANSDAQTKQKVPRAQSPTRDKELERDKELDLEGEALRALVDAYNEAFGTRLTYSPGNLKAAKRCLAEGYTLEQARTVFAAVRERSTATASWCSINNREFEYLVRPTYRHHKTHEPVQSVIDRILNELSTGKKAS